VDDFKELVQMEGRIARCKDMSTEIEHFESRVSKVEEYIRQDKINELKDLLY